jgi:hypothetical protein
MELPANLLELTRDPELPALPDAEISALALLVNASPEAFQAAAGRLFRRLAIEGFRTIKAPRNYKELATVVDLWRKLEGMDKHDKGSMPAGLVGVLRSVNRRAVVEVVSEVDEPGFE